jgi:hypothetical protein
MLPFLSTANTYPQDIGYSDRNYINPNFNKQLLSKVGPQYSQEDLRQGYLQGNRKLDAYRPYGINSSFELLKQQLPGVDVYSGALGNEYVDEITDGNANARGVQAKHEFLMPGNQFVIAVRGDVDNAGMLQTAAHEAGHYIGGHSNPESLPDYNDAFDEPVIKPKFQRTFLPRNAREIEAEMVAAMTMNRLGYGYSPGLQDRSGSYIAGYQQREGKPISEPMVRFAENRAKDLVPNPIRRFGPISRVAVLVK